jgi:signal transduction histidine kinase
MLAQLEELLDLAQLQAGRPLALQRHATDLVALARTSMHEHQQTTRQHQLHLVAPMERLVGQWDALRLARVLNNLLSNAIKYSPEGGAITLQLAQEDTAQQPWAVLTVQDQGVGIALSELDAIFEPFRRVGDLATQTRGSGLGLASVRQIVEQHGGCISLRSKERAGSVFTVRLQGSVRVYGR